MTDQKEIHQFVIIGSGPAGWASAEALISKGISPLVIDLGLVENNPAFIFPNASSSNSEVAKKTRFHSDHMYQSPQMNDVVWEVDGTLPVSSGFGGLSSVWGTNIQGFEWPTNDSETKLSFGRALKEIASRLNHTGQHDGLENVYRWPVSFPDVTPMSTRMKKILARLNETTNVTFTAGMARNATSGTSTGCIYCGLCLTGCPQNVTFSTEQPIKTLITSGKISYIQGQVTTLTKRSNGWTIELIHPNDGKKVSVQSHNVLLGAGSVMSAIILQRSDLIPNQVELTDTQVCYIPFLSIRDRAEKTTGYSLAQVFIETTKTLFGKNSFHISLYEHSDSFKERARYIAPRLSRIVPKWAYRRLVAGISFLSSENSGRVNISKSSGVITVSTTSNSISKKALKIQLSSIFSWFTKAGLIPISFLATLPNPGASYHLGNLKSSTSQKSLALPNGQLINHPGIYLIDSCSLPEVPAGPITFGIMANSFRIASEIHK